MLSIFYIPYVLFAPPIGMLGKKYGTNIVLPIMMFCFGSLTLLMATAKNFAGMMTLRWFLGMLRFLDSLTEYQADASFRHGRECFLPARHLLLDHIL